MNAGPFALKRNQPGARVCGEATALLVALSSVGVTT